MPDRPPQRAIVVTGASSGIGRSLAIAAAANGFAVLLVARRAERLADVAREIRDAGGVCETLAIDVTAHDAATQIVEAAMRPFGRIDVIVNNAGRGAYGELLAQTDAQIEEQWQLHVAAPLRIARAALPHVERAHGQLIFVGSGLARVPLPRWGAYATVKAAIRAASTQLRRELRSRGVAVTYVDPGVVATEFHAAIHTKRPARITAVKPERVARAIVRGIERRAAAINAVPLHAAGAAAGALLGSLADSALFGAGPERDESVAASSSQPPPPSPVPQPEPGPKPSPPPSSPALPTFEDALEPVARRMERVKLSHAFVREALQPGATLELNELAMRWAGMPNKNERAAVHEVLDTLTAAGYLEPIGDETWKVVRAAG
jgi:short-subunit dehydrogenase